MLFHDIIFYSEVNHFSNDLYSNLYPGPFVKSSDLNTMKISLLDDMKEDGISDPQYLPTIGEFSESPSKMVKESHLK